jgi:hypothetical protein
MFPKREGTSRAVSAAGSLDCIKHVSAHCQRDEVATDHDQDDRHEQPPLPSHREAQEHQRRQDSQKDRAQPPASANPDLR